MTLAGGVIVAGVLTDAGYKTYELTKSPEAEHEIKDSMPCMMAYQTAKNIPFSEEPYTKVEATAPVIGHLISHEVADTLNVVPFTDQLTQAIDEYSQKWCKETAFDVLNGGIEVAGK
jgi:hypothetical protein